MVYDESMNNKVYNILENIKYRYNLFIGDKSIHKLTIFLGGFECGLKECLDEYIPFDTQFQIFIENKRKICCPTKHWSNILLENISQEEAFDLFFVYLEEFKQIMKTPKVLDNMYYENIKNVEDWIATDD